MQTAPFRDFLRTYGAHQGFYGASGNYSTMHPDTVGATERYGRDNIGLTQSELTKLLKSPAQFGMATTRLGGREHTFFWMKDKDGVPRRYDSQASGKWGQPVDFKDVFTVRTGRTGP